MRILQILPELNQGGVELCVLEIAQALVAAGHESLVISNGGSLVEHEQMQGSQHFKLAIAKKNLLSLWQLPKLIKLINKLKPDLIHVHSRFPAWLIYFAQHNLALKIPIITSVHGLNSVSFYSKIMTRFNRIIAVSQTAKNYIIQNYHIDENKITVIYPGVNTHLFSSSQVATNTKLDHDLAALNPILNTQGFILLPGRIAENKGQNDLIAIMQYFKNHKIDLKAVIAGGGKPERIKKLQEKIIQNNLSNCLYYLGSCDNMPALYQKSGIILSLSHKPESYGRTVMEGLACKKAVLGYAHGGVQENLQRYFPQGLIAVKDIVATAQAIQEWINKSPTLPAITETLEQTQAQHLEFYKKTIAEFKQQVI